MSDAIEAANRKNISFVVAAGNENKNIDVDLLSTPANMRNANVIPVVASDIKET